MSGARRRGARRAGRRAIALAHPGAVAAGGGAWPRPWPPCGCSRGASLRPGRSAGGALALVVAVALAIASAQSVVAAIVRRERAPGDRALARYIEEQCPALEDRLATAVEVGGGGTPLPARASAAPCWPTPRAHSAQCRSTTSCRANGCGVPPCSRVLAAVALVARGRALDRAGPPGAAVCRALRGPRTPGAARVPRRCAREAGRPVRDSRGNDGRVTQASRRSSPSRSAISAARSRMQAAGGDRFAWRFDSVPASFTYSVSAAGRTSETYTVTALDPPRVARIDSALRVSRVHAAPAPRRGGRRRHLRAERHARHAVDPGEQGGDGRGPFAGRSAGACRCSRSPAAASRRRSPSPPTARIGWL